MLIPKGDIVCPTIHRIMFVGSSAHYIRILCININLRTITYDYIIYWHYDRMPLYDNIQFKIARFWVQFYIVLKLHNALTNQQLFDD